jgi:hypothetical protein
MACPKCNEVKYLTYAVNKIALEDKPPSFTARILCGHCGKKSIFSRLVSKLKVWSIKEVEIAFPGTKIKVVKGAA